MSIKHGRVAALIRAVSLALFSVSLFLPVFKFQNHKPVMGYSVLLSGWFGLLELHIAWLANPLYFYALKMLKRQQTSRALCSAVLAVAVSLDFVRVEYWWFNEGNPTRIEQFGSAPVVWIGSLLTLAIAILLSRASTSTVG